MVTLSAGAPERVLENQAFGSVPVLDGTHPLRWPLMRPAVGPAAIFGFAAVIYLAVPLAWSAASQRLTGSDGLFVPQNQYLPLVPVLLAAIGYYYRETSFLFDKLAARGALHYSSDPFDAPQVPLTQIVESITHSVLGKIGTALPALVTVIVPVLVWTNGTPPEHRLPLFGSLVSREKHSIDWLVSANGVRLLGRYFVPLFHGFVLGAVAAWAFGHLRVARVLSHVMKGEHGVEVRLRVPHPDGCMGLGPVGDLARQTVLVLVVLSLVLFLWTGGITLEQPQSVRSQWLHQPPFLMAWGLYCVFSPILFFAPLAAARRRMWTAKQDRLASVGARVMMTAPRGTRSKTEALYARIDSTSVWPFTWRTLSSFASSILLPLLLAVLSELVATLLKSYGILK